MKTNARTTSKQAARNEKTNPGTKLAAEKLEKERTRLERKVKRLEKSIAEKKGTRNI